jgi:predicted SnoaL-like aldol condensation-catalyzing enzyme
MDGPLIKSVAADDVQGEKNIQSVLALYEQMINQHDPRGAVKVYLRPDYIQHNPLITTGAEGLGDFFSGVKDAFPRVHVEVKNVIAQGDWVWAHVNFFNTTNNDADDRGVAAVDVYRFDPEGLIAEHWDVLQPIGDPAEAANPNTMF